MWLGSIYRVIVYICIFFFFLFKYIKWTFVEFPKLRNNFRFFFDRKKPGRVFLFIVVARIRMRRYRIYERARAHKMFLINLLSFASKCINQLCEVRACALSSPFKYFIPSRHIYHLCTFVSSTSSVLKRGSPSE